MRSERIGAEWSRHGYAVNDTTVSRVDKLDPESAAHVAALMAVPHADGKFVLATGDGGFCFGGVTFPDLVETLLGHGWRVVVMSWNKCLNFRYRDMEKRFPGLTLCLLDHHRDALSFSAGVLPSAGPKSVSPKAGQAPAQGARMPGPYSPPPPTRTVAPPAHYLSPPTYAHVPYPVYSPPAPPATYGKPVGWGSPVTPTRQVNRPSVPLSSPSSVTMAHYGAGQSVYGAPAPPRLHLGASPFQPRGAPSAAPMLVKPPEAPRAQPAAHLDNAESKGVDVDLVALFRGVGLEEEVSGGVGKPLRRTLTSFDAPEESLLPTGVPEAHPLRLDWMQPFFK